MGDNMTPEWMIGKLQMYDMCLLAVQYREALREGKSPAAQLLRSEIKSQPSGHRRTPAAYRAALRLIVELTGDIPPHRQEVFGCTAEGFPTSPSGKFSDRGEQHLDTLMTFFTSYNLGLAHGAKSASDRDDALPEVQMIADLLTKRENEEEPFIVILGNGVDSLLVVSGPGQDSAVFIRMLEEALMTVRAEPSRYDQSDDTVGHAEADQHLRAAFDRITRHFHDTPDGNAASAPSTGDDGDTSDKGSDADSEGMEPEH